MALDGAASGVGGEWEGFSGDDHGPGERASERARERASVQVQPGCSSRSMQVDMEGAESAERLRHVLADQ